MREAVRYRAKLSRLRAGLKAQVHQTLGKEGVIPELDSIWGPSGQRWLDDLRLGDEYVNRIASLRDLIEDYDREIHDCDVRIYRRFKGHPGYEAIQALRGVGPVLAAVFVAEIGDVDRFANPRRLCSWAGLTPRHRESDSHIHRGRVTKQGSRLLRWAAVEAVSGAVRDPQIASIKARVGAAVAATSAASPPPANYSPSSLRAARRRDPLPQRSGVRSGHGQRATRERHDPPPTVWSSTMSELPLVVTHGFMSPARGVTKVCPGTRTTGCPHLDRDEDTKPGSP